MINGPLTTNGIFGIIVAALTPLVLWEPLKQRQRWAIYQLIGIAITAILSGQRNNLLLLGLGLIALSSLWSRRTRLIGLAILVATVVAIYPFTPTLQQRSSWMISSEAKWSLHFRSYAKIQAMPNQASDCLIL